MITFGLGMAFATLLGKTKVVHKKVCIHNFYSEIDTCFLLAEWWQSC